MNYGDSKGSILALTALTGKEQVAVILAAIILITAIAVLLRKVWRHNKNIGDK